MQSFRCLFAGLGSLLLLGSAPANRHALTNPYALDSPYPLTSRHPLIIRFRNEVGPRSLHLRTASYTNQSGEPFTVEQFKYYISGIRVRSNEGEELIQDEPHLVDQGDSASLELRLSSNLSGIQSIHFAVGVDSLANVSGVQTGDMDPMMGMFWTWNSGYINARLEGESDSAQTPAHRFTWDIGGYKEGRNALRTITLALPQRNEPAGDNLVCIRVDLLQWFDGIQPIRIAQTPVCHEPGPLAMKIANNYSTMFSICP
jgi:hypothetical protein